MRQAEMLSITQAARSAGVTVDLVRTQIEQGSIPAVRDEDGLWQIPRSHLETLAGGSGLQLDLRNGTEAGAGPSQSDILAAQAAVLLARTQATAARFQSEDFLRRLRQANSTAAADREARQRADDALTQAEQSLSELRRDQAVAEAKVQELRRQLTNDERHFQFMVDRIASLEWERQRLTQSLGWLGRIRYRRMASHSSAPPKLDAATLIDAPTPVSSPTTGRSDDGQRAKISYPPPETYPPPEMRSLQNTDAVDPMATVQSLDAIA